MKLFYSPTSPYSRKARLAIHFKQLGDDITQVSCNPFIDLPEDSHHNPLGKVPSLMLDNGRVIFDSPVICEYLDRLSHTSRLYPEETSEWIGVKTAEALGDGTLDAAYNIVMERRRAESERSNAAIHQWKTEIARSLRTCEKMILEFNDAVTQAHISMVCTLGYLDFRLADVNWRDYCSPDVSKWYTDFQNKHPIIADTRPL